MNCPNCSASNRETARFCRRCGQWLDGTCPNCKADLPDSPVFCDRCGYQVSPIPATGQQWVNRESRPAPLHSPADAMETQPPIGDRRPAAPPSQPTTPDTPARPADVSPLQKYIPKELFDKLEAARASGTMAGERRVVTMLFCDVKGSTEAAEGLDPEDWTEIINGAFEHMIKPVYHYEGTVARLMGDGILAFFGAPIAHEDDPQRAVLASLDIITGLEPYREAVRGHYALDLNVRVGINTGPVVVGAVGSDLRMEYTAMGDAINLASRMEQTARPGSVQIAHDTYRLVAPLFEFEALGGIQVKGKDEPVLAYRVLGRKTDAGRVRGIAGLEVPLVGRAPEMAAFTDAFHKLQKGVGGIVGLIGEAGLGKSRLIRELKASASDHSGISWVETFSQSYETSQPYNLFRRLIQRLINAAPNDPPEVLRQKISTLVGTSDAEHADASQRVFESLFGLEGSEGEPPLEGETFKQLFQAATRDLWQARADHEPAVLVCDDLHWADPASVELLSHLLQLTEKAPLLLICSMRPERQSPGWQLKSTADSDYLHRYTEFQLRPLSDEHSEELLTSLAPGAAIPARLRQRILEKAAGNPYYLEEVVRGLMESRALIRENGAFHWAAAEDIVDFDLPDNLQSLLVARIDRLEEGARRTLQLASVVGRSFYYRVLTRVGEETRDLDPQLDRLVRANMIREVAREPELEYVFSNVLTQEAAYQTILLRHRRQFHRQVGETLESLFPERREELAPVLAVHFSEAGDLPRSIEYRTLAGDAAYRLYALDEAIDQYRRALDLALNSGEAQAPSEQLIHLYTRLGRAHEHSYQTEQVREIYEELRDLAAARGDRAMQLAYCLAMGTLHVTPSPLSDLETGRSLAQEALELAEELGDRRGEARARWNLMLLNLFLTGDMQAAKQQGEDSLEIARELGWEKQVAYILNDLAHVYTGLLDLPKALNVLAEARERWREMSNLPMLADNLNVSGNYYNFAGDFDRAHEMIHEGIRIARSIGNNWNEIPLIANLSEGYLDQGELGAALETVLAALAVSEVTGVEGLRIVPLYQLAQVCSELGLVERGLEACEGLLRLDLPSRLQGPLTRLAYALQARLHLVNNDLNSTRAALENVHPDVSRVTIFPFTDQYLGIAACEGRLAFGDHESVLALTGDYIPTYERAGIRRGLADLHYYRGLALLATEGAEAARSSLLTAREIAEEIGSRRILWKILAALAEIEGQAGNASEAESFRGQAREIVFYITEHAGGEQNRASFLARKDVRDLVTSLEAPDRQN